MAWLKRRYQRFCYDCSWRYPRLNRFVVKVKFPVQVSALCLALFTFVSFYQKHYSFEASMRAHQAQLANFETNTKPLSAFHSTVQTRPESHNYTASPGQGSMTSESDFLMDAGVANGAGSTDTGKIQLNEQILIAEKSLRAQVQKAEQALLIKTRETEILKAKIAKANELLEAETNRVEQLKTGTQTSSHEQDDFLLLNGRWISKQRMDSYIIQLASSTKDTELVEYARGLSSQGPLAIYPFKKTKDGKLLFGLSTGLYGSSSEAAAAAAQLPIESAPTGSWIRKVADVSSQIATFQ